MASLKKRDYTSWLPMIAMEAGKRNLEDVIGVAGEHLCTVFEG